MADGQMPRAVPKGRADICHERRGRSTSSPGRADLALRGPSRGLSGKKGFSSPGPAPPRPSTTLL